MAALFAELGATAGLEGGTPAEGFSQIPGEDGAFEATGAFACLLNEALPAAKQPKTRAQGFAGRQPDAGVEDALKKAGYRQIKTTLIDITNLGMEEYKPSKNMVILAEAVR